MVFSALFCNAQASPASPLPSQLHYETAHMEIQTDSGKVPFSVELAVTPEQHRYGLMNRTAFPEDYAMLFLFSEDAKYSMWMKDTPMPLDMLFVEATGRISYIKIHATPYSLDAIAPPAPVRAVIEMPAGAVEVHRIAVGDKVLYPAFKP